MKKVNHYNYLFPVGLLLSLTATTSLLLTSKYSSAESSSANASVTVPEACTMTSTNDTPHTATIMPNTYSGASGSEYENGIGKTTLTAICNDDNGFSIYAIGYTGNQYSGENHTKLVGSTTGGAIATKAYASGDTTSNWSMKLTKITDSAESYNPQNLTIQSDTEGSFDTWHSVPDTYTKVAQYHANTGSSTTDTTLGVKLETTYAAYIASNQPADTYIGQVKYTMVHPYNNTAKDGPIADCPPNKICYSPNANDIEGTMGQQSISETSTSATLLAGNFSRKGYGFAGWSDRYDYSNDNGAKFYGPQETISFTAGEYSTTNGGLRLYAIWVPSQGSLQDQSKVTSICNSLTTAPTDGTANLSSVSALTDQRDNDTYAIAKLADGKCWMIENLRLDNTAAHNSDGSLAQGYGASSDYGNFGGLADAENSNFENSIVANSFYYSGAREGVASIDIGVLDHPGYRMPRYNALNTSSRAFEPTANSGNKYSYGNYYTWHAAIASLIYNGANNQSTTGTSLCPSGWHLPIGGDKSNEANNELWSLVTNGINGGTKPANYSNSTRPYYTGTLGRNTSNKLRAYPNNFLFSGFINGSSMLYRGSRGNYWSSTALTGSVSYTMYLDDSFVYPGTYDGNKTYGQSIKCVVGS